MFSLSHCCSGSNHIQSYLSEGIKSTGSAEGDIGADGWGGGVWGKGGGGSGDGNCGGKG